MSSGKSVYNIPKQNPKEDAYLDAALRPEVWDEYIGQESVKRNLALMMKAAQERKEPIDHVLLYGPAGLGKTTLAGLVARQMGGHLRVTSGPVLSKAGDMAAILSTLEEGDVLFIDEAHRINRAIEEMLYPAMESGVLHVVVGKGPGARMLSLSLPRFTLMAATTRVNLLSSPLRTRFGGMFHLDYYSLDDIRAIINRSAHILDVALTDEAVDLLAKASRFTPRIANRLLKRVRDFCQVQRLARADIQIARAVLDMFAIDEQGLEEHDRKLLRAIIERFSGGPVGVNALASALGEDRDVIEEVYEPYLVKTGFVTRTPAGRMATELAYRHLNIPRAQ